MSLRDPWPWRATVSDDTGLLRRARNDKVLLVGITEVMERKKWK